MLRGPRIAASIEKNEAAIMSRLANQDPDDPIPFPVLVRLLDIVTKQMGVDLKYLQSLLMPKKGDLLSAIPPVAQDDRSVPTHEHPHDFEFSPAQWELLRNIIQAFEGKGVDEQTITPEDEDIQ